MRARRSTHQDIPDVSEMDPWKDDRCRDFVALNVIQRLRAYHLPPEDDMPEVEPVNAVRATNLLLLPRAKPDYRPCRGEHPRPAPPTPIASPTVDGEDAPPMEATGSEEGASPPLAQEEAREGPDADQEGSLCTEAVPSSADNPALLTNALEPDSMLPESAIVTPRPSASLAAAPLSTPSTVLPLQDQRCVLHRARLQFFGNSTLSSCSTSASVSPRLSAHSPLHTPAMKMGTGTTKRTPVSKSSEGLVDGKKLFTAETSARDSTVLPEEMEASTPRAAESAGPPTAHDTDTEKSLMTSSELPSADGGPQEKEGVEPVEIGAEETAENHETCEEAESLIAYYQSLLTRGVVLDRFNHKDLGFAWWVLGKDMSAKALEHTALARREALLITVKDFYYSQLSASSLKRRSGIGKEGDHAHHSSSESDHETAPSARASTSSAGKARTTAGASTLKSGASKASKESAVEGEAAKGDGAADQTASATGSGKVGEPLDGTKVASTGAMDVPSRRPSSSVEKHRKGQVEETWTSCGRSQRLRNKSTASVVHLAEVECGIEGTAYMRLIESQLPEGTPAKKKARVTAGKETAGGVEGPKLKAEAPAVAPTPSEGPTSRNQARHRGGEEKSSTTKKPHETTSTGRAVKAANAHGPAGRSTTPPPPASSGTRKRPRRPVEEEAEGKAKTKEAASAPTKPRGVSSVGEEVASAATSSAVEVPGGKSKKRSGTTAAAGSASTASGRITAGSEGGKPAVPTSYVEAAPQQAPEVAQAPLKPVPAAHADYLNTVAQRIQQRLAGDGGRVLCTSGAPPPATISVSSGGGYVGQHARRTSISPCARSVNASTNRPAGGAHDSKQRLRITDAAMELHHGKSLNCYRFLLTAAPQEEKVSTKEEAGDDAVVKTEKKDSAVSSSLATSVCQPTLSEERFGFLDPALMGSMYRHSQKALSDYIARSLNRAGGRSGRPHSGAEPPSPPPSTSKEEEVTASASPSSTAGEGEVRVKKEEELEEGIVEKETEPRRCTPPPPPIAEEEGDRKRVRLEESPASVEELDFHALPYEYQCLLVWEAACLLDGVASSR